MTLGLTNGSQYAGITPTYNSSRNSQCYQESSYGANVSPTEGASTDAGVGGKLGVTTDPEKSGIIANLPTYTVNVWRRTA